MIESKTLDQIMEFEKDESIREEIVRLLSDIVSDPLEWMVTPNLGFGCTPSELIKSGRGDLILDRLRGIVYGVFS